MTKGIDEITTSGVSPGALPLLRVRLCGPFHMEWVDQTSGNPYLSADPSIGGRDRAAALSLLALLLCQPNRQAHRDWVMEQFWPEGSREAAIHRLENIFSCLRKLLRSPFGGESLVRSFIGKKSSGPSYCLDAYPIVWVDRDALTWYIEQACRMERFADNALPFWQRAFDLLSRGAFLVDAPYDPYAAWVKEQRDRHDGYARQCVHALSRLYLSTSGEVGKPEVLPVRAQYEQHQTDEDVLRPLLELLGEQECYQEAEQYYQQLLLALAEQGSNEQGQPRTPDPRTYDLAEYLRTKQLRRTSLSASSLAPVVQLSQTTLHKTGVVEQGVLVPGESGMWLPHTLSVQTPSFETASLDIATWFGARVNDLKAFGVFWHGPTITCQQQQTFIQAEIDKWSKMTQQDDQPTNEYLITRRIALATLATLSSSLLAKVQFGPLTTFVIEEFLAQCTTSITTCWHLMQGRELAIVQQALTRYLPVLRSWARQPSSYQQTSAYLAAQGCLLKGLLSLHSLPMPQNFQKRAFYCTQATEYAYLSADPSLQITALAHLANAQYDMGQPDNMLQTYQKALSMLDDLSKKYQFPSLLHSKLQVELAHAYAQQGQVQKSLRALKEARAFFSNESGVVPVFLSTDYGHHSLILFEGLTHLDLEKYAPENNHSRQAADALAQIETVSTSEQIPERFRVEIINQQAFAAIREGNLDNFRRYLLEGAQGAKELESEKRRQETIANWKAARERWPQEKSVLELADVLF